MRMRAGLVAALLLAALAPDALAAKPVCRIVQDARGDAEYPTNGVPGDDGDDLLSADVASDGKVMTAVWRLAELRATNVSAPFGQNFVIDFRVTGSPGHYYVGASTQLSGVLFEYGVVESSATGGRLRQRGPAKGALDLVRDEIRLSVPTKAFAGVRAAITRGKRIYAIDVSANRAVTPRPLEAPGLGAVQMTFDSADGPGYLVGTPSCVRPVT
jgi:hypothetical protein